MERPNIGSEENVNLSDVLAAIQMADPNFVEPNEVEMLSTSNTGTAAAGGSSSRGGNMRKPQVPGMASSTPYVEITEQPASKALRFRYECEGRSAGSIPGVNSTPENKTFPSIRIVGYRGRAIVVVSCVTKDPPYRPHPHNLVGKEICKNGICTVEVSPESNMTVSFDKLGIQCVKRKDIEAALVQREKDQVDPFHTGFEHRRQPTSIDLNAVRLCFQVFIPEGRNGPFNMILKPVVSQTIYDKKAMSDLVICKLSHCSATVAGGTEMVLLCEKVAKEDIQVRFFEERDGLTYWEGFADFQPTQVHKQVAIAFRTPSYMMQKIDQPVSIYIQLRRPSDGATSEPLPFQFTPIDDLKTRKRRIDDNRSKMHMVSKIQAAAANQPGLMSQFPQYNIIKSEPNDRLSPFGGPMTAAAVPAPSPTMFQVPDTSNMNVLQPINSPRRTPSPMLFPYNMPSQQQQQQQQQNLACPLQPIILPQGSPNTYVQNSTATNQLDNSYQLGDTSGIGNIIGDAMNISNIPDNTQQPSDMDINFSSFVDLNSLNLSDIVNEAADRVNGTLGAGAMSTNALDSFTNRILNNLSGNN